MDFCNYNCNIMALNLLDISTTTFRHGYHVGSGAEVLIIESSKFNTVPFLAIFKRNRAKEFKNQWNFLKITYHLFAMEKIMEIRFP